MLITLYNGAQWYNLSSRHAAGVQFAFGDASIRTVRFGDTTGFQTWGTNAASAPYNVFTSDYMVLQQLSGRRDGLNADTSSISD
jgi:hypothetical protein